MTQIDTTRADEIVRAFADKRPLIVGDVMVDEYLVGEVERISPEAPVPVVRISSESYRLGGAGNVASNAAALGAAPILVGLVGEDAAADRLRAELTRLAIDDAHLVETPGRPTTTKTRILAHGQQVVRYDREEATDIGGAAADQLLTTCVDALSLANVLILSDYAKGALTGRLLKELLEAANARNIPVIVDPAVRSFTQYHPITSLTPNHHEASQCSQTYGNDDEAIGTAGRCILDRLDAEHVLITRGEHGMSLIERNGTVTHIATVAREVFDVTGAGDTVITAFALGIAVGASPVESAILANHAAGVVVAKVGTATVNPAELLASLLVG